MITTSEGIWIFIICVGIPLGYGIGYFGLMFVIGFYRWLVHKNNYKSPHQPSKYHQTIPYGASLGPIGVQITPQPVDQRD